MTVVTDKLCARSRVRDWCLKVIASELIPEIISS